MLFNRESGNPRRRAFLTSTVKQSTCSWLQLVVDFLCPFCLPFTPCFFTAALAGLLAVGSAVKVLSCAMLDLPRVAVTCLDASYSWSHTATGFTKPIPPSLAGRASSALSTSEQGYHSVSTGMNFWWMTSYRG